MKGKDGRGGRRIEDDGVIMEERGTTTAAIISCQGKEDTSIARIDKIAVRSHVPEKSLLKGHLDFGK